MYGYVIANSSPDFLMTDKTCTVRLFKCKTDRNETAFRVYCAVYEENKDDIDRIYTKRRLTKKQFLKRFEDDKAVCIQLADYHINFEPFDEKIQKT